MNRKTRKANKMANKRVLLGWIEDLEKKGLGTWAECFREDLRNKNY